MRRSALIGLVGLGIVVFVILAFVHHNREIPAGGLSSVPVSASSAGAPVLEGFTSTGNPAPGWDSHGVPSRSGR